MFSSTDVSSGSENAKIQFKTFANGTLNNTFLISSDKIGIGSNDPGTQLQVEGTEPYITLKNTSSENTDGGDSNNGYTGCESRIIFEDHANNELARLQGNHDGTSNDTKGDLLFFTNNGTTITEAFRVNSTGNIGMGIISPTHKLDVTGTTRFVGNSTINGDLTVDTDTLHVDSANNCIGIGTTANSSYKLLVSGESRFIETGVNANSFVTYLTSDTEGGSNSSIGGVFRFVWDKDSSSNASYPNSNYNVEVHMRANGGSSVRAVGRFENDSAGTTQINFTGQHRCMPSNNLNTTTNNVGKIVVSTGNFLNINNTINPQITESLPLVELANSDNNKRVFGVISDEADSGTDRTYGIGFLKTIQQKTNENEERIHINSVGEGAIWVCNKNGSLENGDYITSSSVSGYGMKQTTNEGILTNYTVAKITCDCNFSLTKTVKQKLKVTETTTDGTTTRNIDFDTNGNYQYEDDLDENGNQQMVYHFDTVFLNSNGDLLTDESEYNTRLSNGESVYIACFVGCSYHCG